MHSVSQVPVTQLAPALVRNEFPLLRALIDAALAAPSPFAACFYADLFRRAPRLRLLLPVHLDVAKIELLLSLRALADGLDFPSETAATLRRMGARHRRLGIGDADYAAAGLALHCAMAQANGTRFDAQAQAAWRHLCLWLLSHLRRG